MGSNYEDSDKLTKIEVGFAGKANDWLEALNRDADKEEGLYLFIQDGRDKINFSHRKKIAVYSKLTLFPVEGIDAPPWERQDSDFGVTYEAGPDLDGCLQSAFRYKTDLRSGLLLPVPEDVAIIDHEGLMDYHQRALSGEVGLDIERMYEGDVELHTRVTRLPEGALRINLQTVDNLDNQVPFGILLPSLDGLPLRDVHKLRRDHHEEFLRFQKALLRFAQESEECDDPSRFREIAQRVEAEIRELDRSIASIRKIHPKTLAAFIGRVAGIVCMLGVPSPIVARAIVAILNTLSSIVLLRQSPGNDKIEQNPFYFPIRVRNAMRRPR